MKKILVVDDDFSQRDLYVEIFKQADYEVISANDGQDGWEKFQKEHADLVFTGIDMPRMTGFELIAKLREDKVGLAVPVVMFSHLGRDEDRQKARGLTNVEFMVKGYDTPAKIVKRVSELLSQDLHIGPKPSRPTVVEEDDRPGVTSI